MKERLTGAIILVVLVVLLVPELLSGPKGPAATPPPATGAASPSSEEPPLRSYTINLGDEHSQSQTANGTEASSGPPQPSVAAQPPTTPDKDAGPDKGLSDSSTWESSAAATSQPPSGSVIKPSANASANTSVPAKANSQTTDRDRQSSRTSPAPSPTASGKPSAAANAGNSQASAREPQPTASRPQAASSKARPAPAEKPVAKQPAAGGESGGWGVQLGVFASKENAERLALEVRVKGFKASVSPVTSGKRKLYRVRVGPAADKSAAQELQTKLKAAGRPDGKVVPYS